MANFQNTIDLLGDEASMKALVERTITEFNDDSLNAIGIYAFYDCSALTSVDFPSVTSIGTYAFYNCSKLTSVDFPALTSIGTYAFFYCSELTSVDFPALTSIGSYAFHYCSKLTTIILRSQTLCTLSNTSAFTGSPFASNGTGGTVYVPQALIEQYQTATNWSTLYASGKCNFVAIEGSEYDDSN